MCCENIGNQRFSVNIWPKATDCCREIHWNGLRWKETYQKIDGGNVADRTARECLFVYKGWVGRQHRTIDVLSFSYGGNRFLLDRDGGITRRELSFQAFNFTIRYLLRSEVCNGGIFVCDTTFGTFL